MAACNASPVLRRSTLHLAGLERCTEPPLLGAHQLVPVAVQRRNNHGKIEAAERAGSLVTAAFIFEATSAVNPTAILMVRRSCARAGLQKHLRYGVRATTPRHRYRIRKSRMKERHKR